MRRAPAAVVAAVIAGTVVADVAALLVHGHATPATSSGSSLDGLALRSDTDNRSLAASVQQELGGVSTSDRSGSSRLYGHPPETFIELDTLPIDPRDGLTPAEILNLIQDKHNADAFSDGFRRVGGIATDEPGHSSVCGDFDSVMDGTQTVIGSWCMFVRDHSLGRVDVVRVHGHTAAELLGRIDH